MDEVAPTNAGSECVKTGARKRSGCLPFFKAGRCYADEWTVERRLFSADWNSPAQQNERPEGDRFIPLLFRFVFSFLNLIYLIGCNLSIAVFNAFKPVWRYFSVVSGDLCPAKCCTIRRSLFLANKLAITLCLIVVAVSFFLDCF